MQSHDAGLSGDRASTLVFRAQCGLLNLAVGRHRQGLLDTYLFRDLVSRQQSRQWRFNSSAVTLAPGTGTTKAVTFSPHFGSGVPITAAVDAAGCRKSTRSTSTE